MRFIILVLLLLVGKQNYDNKNDETRFTNYFGEVIAEGHRAITRLTGQHSPPRRGKISFEREKKEESGREENGEKRKKRELRCRLTLVPGASHM